MGEGRLREAMNDPEDQPSCPVPDVHCLLTCPSRDLQSASAEQICVLVQPSEAGKFQWDDICFHDRV